MFSDSRLIFILFKFMIALFLVQTLITISINITSENQDVYNSCLTSCKYPVVKDGTLGVMGKQYAEINPDKLQGIPSCIQNCNNMYMALRGYEVDTNANR